MRSCFVTVIAAVVGMVLLIGVVPVQAAPVAQVVTLATMY